jgi:hypothetical protein
MDCLAHRIASPFGGLTQEAKLRRSGVRSLVSFVDILRVGEKNRLRRKIFLPIRLDQRFDLR